MNTKWLDYHIRDLTMAKVMAKQAQERPEKIYLRTTGGDALSYLTVDLATNRIVNWLRGLGVGEHGNVAVMMDNSGDCLLILLALAKAGIITTPLNVNARGSLLAHYLNLADVECVIADTQFAEQLSEVASDAPRVKTLILSEPPGRSPNGYERILSLGSWCDAPDTPAEDRSGHSDLAFIMLTSGTTGPSKGVTFCQSRCFLWDEGVVSDLGINDSDTYLVTTPLTHAAGLFSGAWLMMALGATVAIAPRFSASRYWEDVRATGATFTTLLGAMTSFLEAQPPSVRDRDNPMRMISTGPYPPSWKSFEDRFNLKLVSGYGLSDHSAPTKLPPDAPPDKRGSAGRVISTFEMIIVDEDDMQVPAGVAGECLLRSRYPWRSSGGYYKQPEATVDARRNEWFHTGDCGYLDDDGYFWYVGRKKDAIRRRGENISAYEVEHIVAQHPDVDQVAAYPLKSEHMEDEVAVSVVTKFGTALSAAELIRFCLQKMPDFMTPRFVHLANELPRNLNQRVEKYKLIAWCEDNRSQIWDRDNDPDLRRKPKGNPHSA